MEVNIKSYQNNRMKEVRMNKCLPHRSCEEKHFIILKQAGTALESSSKTGSFDRISNRQEFETTLSVRPSVCHASLKES